MRKEVPNGYGLGHCPMCGGAIDYGDSDHNGYHRKRHQIEAAQGATDVGRESTGWLNQCPGEKRWM